jgi:UDP-N-acetylenolpyruvoylglucosamine reductase
MKYVVDVDALIECLDCVDSIKVNGAYYIEVQLLKEFIQRFPKEKVNSEFGVMLETEIRVIGEEIKDE